MTEIITATFQDGAFVPEQEVSIPAGTRVRLTVEPVDETNSQNSNDSQASSEQRPTTLEELCERSPIHSGLRLTRDQLHERD